MTKEERREKLKAVCDDFAVMFLYYNRKEDEDLPVGTVEEMILNGEVTLERDHRLDHHSAPQQPCREAEEVMSIEEIYNPTFSDFHGKPIVTWQEKRGGIRVATNMFAQYNNWMSSKQPKDEPGAAFWETNGPAIVRALRYVGCSALMFEYETDRKVAYRWFGRKTEVGPFGPVVKPDWFYICNVLAEGGCEKGNDTRVRVTLPTDEDVTFLFNPTETKQWFKQKPPEEVKS